MAKDDGPIRLRIAVGSDGQFEIFVKAESVDDAQDLKLEEVTPVQDAPWTAPPRYDEYDVRIRGRVSGKHGTMLTHALVRGIPFLLAPKPTDGEHRISLTHKELEFLVTHGAQLLGKEVTDIGNLDPSKIPTRAQMEHELDHAYHHHPLASMPGFRRFLQTITLLRQYISWLPDRHRMAAENDIKFIERRLEELAMFRDFVRSLKSYGSRVMSPATSSEMYQETLVFVRRIAEAVGIDLWGNEGSTFGWRE